MMKSFLTDASLSQLPWMMQKTSTGYVHAHYCEEDLDLETRIEQGKASYAQSWRLRWMRCYFATDCRNL